jgi:predicted TIM-barrel fold metal-dependent hydrolase
MTQISDATTIGIDAAFARNPPPSSEDLQSSRSSILGCGIIDVHAHALLPVWMEASAKAQGCSLENVSISGVPAPVWTPEGHLAVMDEHGISTSILSWPLGSTVLKGLPGRELARRMNESYAEIAARYPGRFGGFAALPYDDMDAALSELCYALDVLNLDGVLCPTNVDGLYLGDPELDPLLQELDRRNGIIFVHPTPPKGAAMASNGLNVSILDFMFDTTRMVANVIFRGATRKFPNVRIISTHGGGTVPYLAPRLGLLEPHWGVEPGYVRMEADEIRVELSKFYFDVTASTSPTSLFALSKIVDPSHLLMGFDYPMMPARTIEPAIAEFSQYEWFSAAQKQAVARDNAARLLPRFVN